MDKLEIQKVFETILISEVLRIGLEGRNENYESLNKIMRAMDRGECSIDF